MFNRWLLLGLLCWGLFSAPVHAATPKKFNPQADPLSVGDQADVEISRGLFIDSEVGLLTFLVGDGALVYRPGMLVSLRLGYDINKTLTFYGRLGGAVTGNTACFSDPRGKKCKPVKDRFGFPPKIKGRPLPRQGVSLLAGLGLRWAFLVIDERWFFHTTLEALGQFIPSDSIPEEDMAKVTNEARKKLVIGAGFGLGFGLEYFFILKHFSFAVNARAYYFLTPFMDKSMLGLAAIVSTGLKYTF